MHNFKNNAFLLGMGVALFAGIPFVGSEEETGQILADDPPSIEQRYSVVGQGALLPISSSFDSSRVARRMTTIVTAYSSTSWQTDDTPFLTASGTRVRDGIVAANFLPIGTLIKLPELYGDKVFVVEDRMHSRKRYQVDIWFASTQDALDFGAKRATIEILEG